MHTPNTDDVERRRELAIDRYVRAYDQGDWGTLAEVTEAALHDPELDRMLIEVNAALHAEAGLQPISEQAELVRDLLRQYLPSAFVDEAVLERPVTVGDVAARLQADHAAGKPLSASDLKANESLRGSNISLPPRVTAVAIEKLAKKLQVAASERYWEFFRRAAVMLGISRERGRMQLAATRRQRSTRRRDNTLGESSKVDKDK